MLFAFCDRLKMSLKMWQKTPQMFPAGCCLPLVASCWLNPSVILRQCLMESCCVVAALRLAVRAIELEHLRHYTFHNVSTQLTENCLVDSRICGLLWSSASTQKEQDSSQLLCRLRDTLRCYCYRCACVWVCRCLCVYCVCVCVCVCNQDLSVAVYLK